MKYIHLTIFSLFSFLFFACQNNSTSNTTGTNTDHAEQEEAWNKMMAVHDEVMPKISTINLIAQRLKTPLESDSTMDDNTRKSLSTALNNLESAEEAMFDWMNKLKQLNQLRSSMSHEEIMAYLQAEQQKIDKVKSDMLGSIQAGATFIKGTAAALEGQ